MNRKLIQLNEIKNRKKYYAMKKQNRHERKIHKSIMVILISTLQEEEGEQKPNLATMRKVLMQKNH